MVVERGISQRQNRLGPGVCVTCKAREFGEDYAKELFGRGWKSGRLKGKIEKAVGNHEWSVRCAAPPLPCRRCFFDKTILQFIFSRTLTEIFHNLWHMPNFHII
jgi:hypothetical protein